MASLFILLESDWAVLASSPLPEPWQDEPALTRHRTVGELVTAAQRRGDPAASDQILAALVRFAAVDDRAGSDLAARALLQALLPGAKTLARRLQWLGDPAERAAAVVACLYERIRAYPYQRRPARIAANLLGDTLQWLLRGAPGRPRVEVSLDELVEHGVSPEAPSPEVSSGEELMALLAWAVVEGHLSREQARLIGMSRIADVPCEQLGTRVGLGAHSLRRRRQRAEQGLRWAARMDQANLCERTVAVGAQR